MILRRKCKFGTVFQTKLFYRSNGKQTLLHVILSCLQSTNAAYDLKGNTFVRELTLGGRLMCTCVYSRPSQYYQTYDSPAYAHILRQIFAITVYRRGLIKSLLRHQKHLSFLTF